MPMQLSAFLSDNKLTLQAFGSIVGVSGETVRRWADGSRFPHGDMLIRIAETTEGQVQANDFVETLRLRAEKRTAEAA